MTGPDETGKKPPQPRAAESEPAFDRPRTSDLISKGGKVSRSGLYHAAQAEAEAKRLREAQASPAETITDEDFIAGEPTADLTDAEPEAEDGEIPAQKVTFKLKRDLNKRLDKYLTDRISFMSRAKLQALIEDGGVIVNGRPGKNSTNLRQNDVVEVYIPPPPSPDVMPEEIPLDVMFEDEHIIVINKSPDIIVHPARAHNKGTMVNALAWHFRNRGGALSQLGKEFARPGVIHRLDRQTSGVIVFAKTEHAHWRIASQFEHRQTDKRYVAFVHGSLARDIETIDLPMGPSPSREKGVREKQVVRHDHLGKPALTIARVLGRYRVPAENARERARLDAIPGVQGLMHASVIEVELKTGRTHQIRVHLQHLGHPLLADDLYAGAPLSPRPPAWPGLARVGLHAAMLTFRHPGTDKSMQFVAPLPQDLRSLLTAMRADSIAGEQPPPHGCVLSIGSLLG